MLKETLEHIIPFDDDTSVLLLRLGNKKAAAVQKPCLDETGGDKTKKEVDSDSFFEMVPPINDSCNRSRVDLTLKRVLHNLTLLLFPFF